MLSDNLESITKLYRAWRAGDTSAQEPLFNQIYPELQSRAPRFLRANRGTSARGLIHEAWIRLSLTSNLPEINDRTHLLNLICTIMHDVSVDWARRRWAVRRKAQLVPIDTKFDRADLKPNHIITPDRILALHQGLAVLGKDDPTAAHLLKFYYFTECSLQEVAEHFGLSKTTAARQIKVAIARLAKILG